MISRPAASGFAGCRDCRVVSRALEPLWVEQPDHSLQSRFRLRRFARRQAAAGPIVIAEWASPVSSVAGLRPVVSGLQFLPGLPRGRFQRNGPHVGSQTMDRAGSDRFADLGRPDRLQNRRKNHLRPKGLRPEKLCSEILRPDGHAPRRLSAPDVRQTLLLEPDLPIEEPNGMCRDLHDGMRRGFQDADDAGVSGHPAAAGSGGIGQVLLRTSNEPHRIRPADQVAKARRAGGDKAAPTESGNRRAPPSALGSARRRRHRGKIGRSV